MTPITETDLIELDTRGVAYIAGSRIKVKYIALDILEGASPAQIQESYPHLSNQQIASALSYFYSHQVAIEAEIAQGNRDAEALRSKISRKVNRSSLERRRDAAT